MDPTVHLIFHDQYPLFLSLKRFAKMELFSGKEAGEVLDLLLVGFAGYDDELQGRQQTMPQHVPLLDLEGELRKFEHYYYMLTDMICNSPFLL